MKRRGFLGMLAGLVALPGAVVAAVTRKTGATTIESLPFKQPDPGLFALIEQIKRDLEAEYVGIDIGKCGYCGQHRPLSKFHILRHANSCSNQNCIRPLGPYIGAKECGCASPHEYCEECTARIAAEFERLSHEARFTDTHAWYLKGGEHLPKFERSRNVEVTRARIQTLLNELQDADVLTNSPRFHT